MAIVSHTTLLSLLKIMVKNIFLLVNVVFSLFYVLGILATIVSPLDNVVFQYFGLFMPVIIICNICFIIFWLIKRSKYWIISTALLLFTYPHVNNTFTIPFAKLLSGKIDKELVLLSYNISSLVGIKDFKNFKNYIDLIDPDIVCFQEFGFYHNDKNKDRLHKAMKEHYPYSHIWYKNQTRLYSWGVATFSKFPIINKKKIEYNSLYNVSIFSDMVIDDDTVRVINNHLESNKFTLYDIKKYRQLNEEFSGDKLLDIYSMLSNKLSKAYKIRASQANAVRKEIDESPYRLIVCGDFNDVTESYTYHKIKGKLKDLFTHTAWGYRYSFRSNSMFVGIDHILVDKTFVPLCLKIDRKTYSDHYPLIGKFGFCKTK